MRAGNGELEQQMQLIMLDALRYVRNDLILWDRAVKSNDDKATLQSTV